MSGMEVPLGVAIAKGVASGAGSYAAQKALSRMELLSIKPLKESLGITFALSLQADDVLEEDVASAFSESLSTLQEHKGLDYQADRFVTDVNGSKIEILWSSYGTLDELDDEELGELYERIEDRNPMSLLEPNSSEEIQPTVSSISVFFIPRNVTDIDDLPKIGELVSKLNQELTRRISNRGSMKYLFLTISAKKLPSLAKLVKKLSSEYSVKNYEYQNQNAQLGYQILNPSESQLVQIVKGLKSEFGGTLRKINPIRR